MEKEQIIFTTKDIEDILGFDEIPEQYSKAKEFLLRKEGVRSLVVNGLYNLAFVLEVEDPLLEKVMEAGLNNTPYPDEYNGEDKEKWSIWDIYGEPKLIVDNLSFAKTIDWVIKKIQEKEK